MSDVVSGCLKVCMFVAIIVVIALAVKGPGLPDGTAYEMTNTTAPAKVRRVHAIPSSDVHVVYFKDAAADLCYALLQGRVLIESNWSYGFGNVVVVPCDKALWSQMDSVP